MEPQVVAIARIASLAVAACAAGGQTASESQTSRRHALKDGKMLYVDADGRMRMFAPDGDRVYMKDGLAMELQDGTVIQPAQRTIGVASAASTHCDHVTDIRWGRPNAAANRPIQPRTFRRSLASWRGSRLGRSAGMRPVISLRRASSADSASYRECWNRGPGDSVTADVPTRRARTILARPCFSQTLGADEWIACGFASIRSHHDGGKCSRRVGLAAAALNLVLRLASMRTPANCDRRWTGS